MLTLIIAPAWIGDMVMAQTLFKWLKEQYPEIVIDLVATASTFPLASRMPEIRQAFQLTVGHGSLQLKERYALGKILRQVSYEHAIVLQNSWKSALVPFFAKIPKRTGWRGELRYGLLNDMRILDKEKYPLMIERFCALGVSAKEKLPTQLPWPVLRVDKENQKKLIAQFHLRFTSSSTWMGKKRDKILALCPGAEYGPSKRWLPEYFAQVGKHYLQQGWQVWILGGPKDQEISEKIQQLCDGLCIYFVGKTSLLDAIDLLAMARTVVTNDSGLMHITAAVQTPLVVVYGSTSPKFTPPLSDQVKILSLNLECSPCFQRTCRFGHYHCLTQLIPKQVIEAVEALNEVV